MAELLLWMKVIILVSTTKILPILILLLDLLKTFFYNSIDSTFSVIFIPFLFFVTIVSVRLCFFIPTQYLCDLHFTIISSFYQVFLFFCQYCHLFFESLVQLWWLFVFFYVLLFKLIREILVIFQGYYVIWKNMIYLGENVVVNPIQ